MKGFLITVIITSVFVLSFPLLIVPHEDASLPTVTELVENVSVRHTGSEQTETFSLRDLTLYETAAHISFDAPIEAIKAQAICSYTLLCYQLQVSGIVTGTALSFPGEYTVAHWMERLGDSYDEAMAVYCQVLEDVYGKFIVYDNAPIMALSHLLNGGMTENGTFLLGEPLPYLQETASAPDALSASKTTSVTIASDNVNDALKKMGGQDVQVQNGITDIRKTTAGNVSSLVISGQSYSGMQVQEACGLPSASFDMAVQGDNVVFTVIGKGHFVGLSTTGAIAMAQDGHNYDQILRYYFVNTEIQ